MLLEKIKKGYKLLKEKEYNEFIELVGELINNEKLRLQQKEKALKVAKNFDIKTRGIL